MLINLITIGQQMPSWVKLGYAEYIERLPKEYHLNLIEIPAKKRYKSAHLPHVIEQEGQQLLAAIPERSYTIALERTGETIDSKTFAKELKDWQQNRLTINFLIGGPEGLSPACHQKANRLWSLSNLTLPHPLVRVLLAEQLYRAYTILINHPYHR